MGPCLSKKKADDDTKSSSSTTSDTKTQAAASTSGSPKADPVADKKPVNVDDPLGRTCASSLSLSAAACVIMCGCVWLCSLLDFVGCATRSVARCPLSASTSEGSCRSSIERTCDSFRSSLPGLLASCRCCCRCCCCCNCRRCRLGEGRALCLLVSVDTVCR